MNFNVDSVEKILTSTLLEKQFENTLIELHSIDTSTKQIFVYIVGSWNSELENKLQNKFRKEIHKKILLAEMTSD